MFMKYVWEVSGTITRYIFHDLVGEADKVAVTAWVSLLEYLNRLWEIGAIEVFWTSQLYLLSTKHDVPLYSYHFYSLLFNSIHKTLLGGAIVLFYRWGNWDLDKITNWPKVTGYE